MKLLTLLFPFLALVALSRAQVALPGSIPTFDGGSPNQIAQLGNCKELELVPFAALRQTNNAAFTLLKNTYGEDAEWVYDNASIYYIAVFLNTAAAAASVGANFSRAVILKPYYSDKRSVNTTFQRLPFGYYFKGFSGIPTPPAGRNMRSDRYRDQGSVEVQTDENGDTHFDVDLYSPKSDYYVEHWEEVLFNEAYNRPTHPGDVIIQVYEDRKLRTGVRCKN